MADGDDSRRIRELIEASSLGTPEARRLREIGRRILAGKPVADLDSYETGYREGESSRTADIILGFSEAGTMDDLLEFFRTVTGDPELEWPGGPDDG